MMERPSITRALAAPLLFAALLAAAACSEGPTGPGAPASARSIVKDTGTITTQDNDNGGGDPVTGCDTACIRRGGFPTGGG
jgi:hypothetical protein